MKKLLLTMILGLLINPVISQNDYENKINSEENVTFVTFEDSDIYPVGQYNELYQEGWDGGYSEGWMDIGGFNSAYPDPLLAPAPFYDRQGFIDGYNRGFKKGYMDAYNYYGYDN